jgi:hypothetical protein
VYVQVVCNYLRGLVFSGGDEIGSVGGELQVVDSSVKLMGFDAHDHFASLVHLSASLQLQEEAYLGVPLDDCSVFVGGDDELV